MVRRVRDGGFTDAGKFDQYFGVVFRNEVLRVAAKESTIDGRSQPLIGEEAYARPDPDVPDQAHAEGRLGDLEKRVFRVMTDDQSQALWAHLRTGASGRELARVLTALANGRAVARNAAEVRLSRARGQVRAALTAVHLAEVYRHVPGAACPRAAESLARWDDPRAREKDRDRERDWLRSHHPDCEDCQATLRAYPLTLRQMTRALELVGRSALLSAPRGWALRLKDVVVRVRRPRMLAGLALILLLLIAGAITYAADPAEPLAAPYAAAAPGPSAAGEPTPHAAAEPGSGSGSGPASRPDTSAAPEPGPHVTEEPAAVTSTTPARPATDGLPATNGLPANDRPPTAVGHDVVATRPLAPRVRLAEPKPDRPPPRTTTLVEPALTATAEAVQTSYQGPCPPAPSAAPRFQATIRVARGPVTVSYRWLTGTRGSGLKKITFAGRGPQRKTVGYTYLADAGGSDQMTLVLISPQVVRLRPIPFDTTCVTPQPPRVTVTAEATRASYPGPCPLSPEDAPGFRATISVSSGPVTVSYRWLTGRGGSDLETITFDGTGPQQRTVDHSETGYLPDRTTTDWVAVDVSSPVVVRSNTVVYAITCGYRNALT